MSRPPSKRTYAPRCATRPASSGAWRNIEKGPCSPPRLLTMPSTTARASAGTWSALVMGVSRAMIALLPGDESMGMTGRIGPDPAQSLPGARPRQPAPRRGAAAAFARILAGMRFGLFFQVPESRGHAHAERYAEMLELIQLADALGFDVAWLAELHFGGAFSLLSNPLMAVPLIAERHPADPRGNRRHPVAAPPSAQPGGAGGHRRRAVGRTARVRRRPGLHPDAVPRLSPTRGGEPRALRRGPRDHPPRVDAGPLQLRRHASTRSRTSRWCRAPSSGRIRPSASASTRRRASRTSATSACPSTRGRRRPRCPSSASAWGSTGSTSASRATRGHPTRWR